MRFSIFFLVLCIGSVSLSKTYIQERNERYKRVQIRGSATIYFEIETLNCTADEVSIVTKESRNEGHFDLLFVDLSEYPGNESACILKKPNRLKSEKIRIEAKTEFRATTIIFNEDADIFVVEE